MASFVRVESTRCSAGGWLRVADGRGPRCVDRMARERPGYVDAVYDEVAANGARSRPASWPTAAHAEAPGGSWGGGKTSARSTSSGRVASPSPAGGHVRAALRRGRAGHPARRARQRPRRRSRTRSVSCSGTSARALGVATAKDLADYFRISDAEARPACRRARRGRRRSSPCRSKAGRTRRTSRPTPRSPRRVDAQALLSPFDSMIWERARTERLFGMHLRIEIYTPAPKRVYGYYVLPFLLGRHARRPGRPQGRPSGRHTPRPRCVPRTGCSAAGVVAPWPTNCR